jgi:hypothetical protein
MPMMNPPASKLTIKSLLEGGMGLLQCGQAFINPGQMLNILKQEREVRLQREQLGI